MTNEDLIKGQEPGLTGLLQALASATSYVQVICLTINGRKVLCLGPVVHAPRAGILVGEVQEIEFGELLPAELAARLISGEFSQGMGLQ